MADSDLAVAVEREFLRDPAAPPSQIRVVFENGIVTLEGAVATLAARRLAEEIAGIVRGVRSVVNRLSLARPSRSSSTVQSAVEDTLRIDPVAETYEIEVSTDPYALVESTGDVGSRAEREQVERTVMTVPGVTEIRNELSIDI